MKTSTKMYLSVVLSTVCIMYYQYQLSKASVWNVGGTGNGNNNIENEVSVMSCSGALAAHSGVLLHHLPTTYHQTTSKSIQFIPRIVDVDLFNIKRRNSRAISVNRRQ